MFELEIGGVVYQFKLGIGFVREINKTVKVTVNGTEIENGMNAAFGAILDGDALKLVDVLYLANGGMNPRLTKKAIENFIDDPDTDIDRIFDMVKEAFTTANATKKMASALLEEVEKKN